MNLEILNRGRPKGQSRLLLFAFASGPDGFSSSIAIHGKYCVLFLAMDAAQCPVMRFAT